MGSLIKNDGHISNTVNNMGLYHALRGRVNGLGYSPNERLIPYLELARFGSAVLIWTFDLWNDLISTLVERWRPKTHTFHLPYGECTVTLEDVALHLGLPVDGSAVTGIGGVLMPDANNNRVHLMYFPLLADLQNVHSYSWGSAVLSMLYRELCRTTKPDVVDIGGCLLLLWSFYPGIRRSYTVSIYHLMIEQHVGKGVNDYFPGSPEHGYHSGFDVFSPLPLQYNTLFGPYPPHYSTPLGSFPPHYSTPPSSSSSMAFGAYDFSSMFRTPLPITEEGVDRRDKLQCECRPSQKYTPKTTPSNHQF
ncbi:hypothetical protein PVK06_007820 [Gossypium arboreum]|uniref:Aminotransferase-like plant mobile domain-containing protein n=1 Tax=Gossypium arboreum TaxID=29729 RepID=A0ABR0QJJ7_GOSAR|nr:hypothetical protein PVK06_007820 [Gossypium arboreum]